MKYLLCFFLLAQLTGCAWLKDDDNSEPPAKLESIEQTVSFKKLWSHDTGKGTDEQLLKLVPVIESDRVFVADRGGKVEALDIDSGRRVWKNTIKAPLSAGPGVGDGKVLLGTSDGELIALDINDGSERWRTQLSSEVLSVPRVHLGVVIVQTVDGNLGGFDSETGNKLWIFDRSVPVLTLRGTSNPLIIGNAVLAGFASGKLYAVDIKTGRQRWEASVAVPHGRSELERLVDIDADAVVRDGILYVVSYQGKLAAVSLSDGAVIWSRELSAFSGLAVDATQVYVTDAISQVWAMASDSGRSMWKQDKLLHRALTGPVRIDQYIVVGDYKGYLHLLSLSDGELVARTRVDSAGIQSVPVVFGQRLFVLGASGELVVYELKDRSS